MPFTVGQNLVCASDITQTFVVSKLNSYSIQGSVIVISTSNAHYSVSDVVLFIPHADDYHSNKDGHPRNCVECCLLPLV
jgi:hypothetical protein